MQAHLEMGEHNIVYEDVQRASAENGRTVDETLDIIARTAAIDRGEHPDEYGTSGTGSGAQVRLVSRRGRAP
jgi:hypothetical protein